MHSLFKQFDINNKNEIDLETYHKAIEKNKDLLEIFEFLSRGISNTVNKREKEIEMKIVQNLSDVELQVENLLKIIECENEIECHEISKKLLLTNGFAKFFKKIDSNALPYKKISFFTF